MPPLRTGVAAYSVDALQHLDQKYDIDVYDERRAHDFVWKHTKAPYDLTVYQLGNSRAHAYQWAYLSRYPGLTVLHDAQLHQARALDLLQHDRDADYRAELRFSHPDAPDGIADLVAAGLGGSLYYLWPMLRLAVERSRAIAVHSEWLAGELRRQFPRASIDVIPMGVRPVLEGRAAAASGHAIRARHGIAADAIVFGTYGKVTAAKRIAPMLTALARVARQHPNVHLLVAGETGDELDVARLAEDAGVTDRVTLAGYVDDAQLDDYLRAADACLCLRWPSSGETSASWLRCLAAGKPTMVTRLVQLEKGIGSLFAIPVDILDEERSIELAMATLASDAHLRDMLGHHAHQYWRDHHTLEGMAGRYVDVMERAMGRRAPESPADLPHLRADATELAKRLTAEMGVAVDFLSGF